MLLCCLCFHLGFSVPVFHRQLDSGAQQNHPLHIDKLATLRAYEEQVFDRKEEILGEEIQFLEEERFDVSIVFKGC